MTFRQIVGPVLLVYPIATVLVSRLLLDQEERAQAEDALRESEGRYRFLAENMIECLWVTDTSMVFTYVNSAVERLSGYKPEEWIGRNAADYYDEENQVVLAAAARAAFEGLPDFPGMSVEAELTAKDGRQVRWS